MAKRTDTLSVTDPRRRAGNGWTGSPERYTPRWLLDAVEAFLGPRYYDPCPARYGSPIEENGLATSWAFQRVYCNPPYGRGIQPWIRKAMSEPTEEIILLVPAYTETQWFAPLFDHSLCFISGRIKFGRPDGSEPQNAPHPSVLVYRGCRHKEFAQDFARFGHVCISTSKRYHLPGLWLGLEGMEEAS